MKCSGKQQTYPSEIDALNKKIKEQKFNDVIDQAAANKKNLTVLNQKIDSEAENITKTFESEIDSVEVHLKSQAEEFKELLKTLTNEMDILRANFTKAINRLEKQSMTYFTSLTTRVDSQSAITQGRPSIS